MKRLFFEICMAVALFIAALEAVHYRNAVLEANIDRKQAWKTVVQLREKCGEAGAHADGSR